MSEDTPRPTRIGGTFEVGADSSESDIEAQVFDQLVAGGVPSEVAAEMAQSVASNALKWRDSVAEGNEEDAVQADRAMLDRVQAALDHLYAVADDHSAAVAQLEATERLMRWGLVACAMGAVAGLISMVTVLTRHG